VGIQSRGIEQDRGLPRGLLEGLGQAAYLTPQSNYKSLYWISFQQFQRTASGWRPGQQGGGRAENDWADWGDGLNPGLGPSEPALSEEPKSRSL